MSDNLGAAIAELASRLDCDEGDISVESMSEVTWRNGALGCPQPGMSYTMALVDGYRILLRGPDGAIHHYHGADGGEPFLCAQPEGEGAFG